MLANHFHLRLVTIYGYVKIWRYFNEYKRLYFTDPLNGVLKQNLLKTCPSKSFFCEVLNDV